MDSEQISLENVDGPEPTLSERRLITLSRAIFVLSAIFMIIGVVGEILFRPPNTGDLFVLERVVFPTLLVLCNGIVARLIINRYPRHAVGWILLVLGFFYSLTDLANSLSTLALNWVSRWSWLPLPIIPMVFMPLYFPNGRLISKRFRLVAVCGLSGLIIAMVSLAIHPGPFDMIGSLDINPYGIPGGAAAAEFLWLFVAIPLLSISFMAAVGSVFLRYRRSAGIERAQMRWVLYTLVLGMVLLTCSPITLLLPRELTSALTPLINLFVRLFGLALPVVIGISILRYRLYDIDLIIRRTLVYGLVTGTLIAIYFVSVVLLQSVFTEITGQQSPAAIVISTLIIAALFNPLRRRVQDFIDRRFFRRKYDAAQTLARFAQTARDETDLEALTYELLSVVQETMQPEQVTIWLKPAGKDRSSSQLP